MSRTIQMTYLVGIILVIAIFLTRKVKKKAPLRKKRDILSFVKCYHEQIIVCAVNYRDIS